VSNSALQAFRRMDISASLVKEWGFVKETPPACTACGGTTRRKVGASSGRTGVEERREDAAMRNHINSDDLAILHVNDTVGLG
jgi:hypothetical protein